MRWICLAMTVCVGLGCRSQSTPLTNPFLAPDRVPPPATGTLAPGTAQPYYAPGDVMPGTAPGVTVPTYPPAGGVTPPPTTAPLQTAPVTPPGGWGQPPVSNPYGVQPTSGYSPVTDHGPIRVAPDNYNLRFDGATSGSDFAQTAAHQQLAVQAPYVYSPPALAQQNANGVQAAQFAATTVPTTTVSGTASDGFRPLGSTPRRDDPAVTRPLENQAAGNTHVAENPNYFGFDATYSWLRGQLQFYPETGYWGLRYVTLNTAPDSYGGVVVINNPEVLVGVQPGDFLLIQGYLETQDNFDGTFLPLYTVEGIQRQR